MPVDKIEIDKMCGWHMSEKHKLFFDVGSVSQANIFNFYKITNGQIPYSLYTSHLEK